MTVSKIVSGGQTGADRGALEAAIRLGIPHGGWVPAGRRAEDGRVPMHFQVREMASPYYLVRTEQNVIDSDATLIFTMGSASGGTRKTINFAAKHVKAHEVIDLRSDEDPAGRVKQWLEHFEDPIVLNIAGPRESSAPGIAGEVQCILETVLG